VNETVLAALEPTQTVVRLCLADPCEVEAEIDEMSRFVQSKHQQRWLWWAIDQGLSTELCKSNTMLGRFNVFQGFEPS
jgi:hypothetical protein